MVREIRPDYWAPLGVWVVREAARKALDASPQKFESIDSALLEMSSRLKTPIGSWKPKASLVKELKCQKTLDFFL
jgi:hypothetical protein